MAIRLPDINDELDAALKALHSTVERVMRLEDRVKVMEDEFRMLPEMKYAITQPFEGD